MIKLKCIVCGQDLIKGGKSPYLNKQSYYYECSPLHDYVGLKICDNQIIYYEVPFIIGEKDFYIASFDGEGAETSLNLKYDKHFFYKEILRVPKFYPLSITDWISDFNKVKEELLKLSMFA
jgi:hypothetical protein